MIYGKVKVTAGQLFDTVTVNNGFVRETITVSIMLNYVTSSYFFFAFVWFSIVQFERYQPALSIATV